MNEEANQQPEAEVEPGSAGAPEGAFTEPTADEIKELYEATGVKAPVPTAKSEKRSKTTDVRAKDDKKKDAGNSKDGKPGDDDSKSKPKATSDSDKDGVPGDDSDKKGKKVSEKDGEVSDKSEETGKGVRDPKSKSDKDSEPGSKANSKPGDAKDGAQGNESKDSEASKEESEEDPEVKRPGKSNPEVERRFQKLTEEKRERDEHIAKLEKQLKEREAAQEKSKIAQEDPEYTIDDFRKVRDDEGNIIDLDSEKAELAWRRWKEGYEQRGAEREAKANQATAAQEREAEAQRQIMEESSKAYDTLAKLQDEYPELVSSNSKFDPDFAADAMPIIEESIQYAEGTEPGNKEGKLPVITGLKMNPKKILDALKKVNTKKRSLPVNGANDNVESRSNVSVPHTRSSDKVVNAANELYKELGIKKRI